MTCVRMHKLIGFYWDARIRELEKKTQTPDEQDELFRRRQVAWMRETRMAVVVSEEQGEVAKFSKWDLDITPHRKLMKDGMALPASMRTRPEYRNMQTMALDDAFKAEEHPLRVAIVCAMWLTGFDVPTLSTLYLDKPLKAHTLMQAIARANRVAEGKNNGLIVDFCGILKHLRQALATFAGVRPGKEVRETDPARPEEELLEELREAIGLVRTFLADRRASLDEVIHKTGFERNAAIITCKEAANENDETRKRFEVMCREVFKTFKACLNLPGVQACREDRDAINIVYMSLQQDREQADITDIIRQLHQVVDKAIVVRSDRIADPSETYDISKVDFERLRLEFHRTPQKHTTVQNLGEAVERRLQRLLLQNPLRTDFQQHYEQIVSEYNREKDRVTIEQTFEALFKLAQELDNETHRAMREKLDEESLTIFDLLKKPDLRPPEIQRIKAVARQLLSRLKEEKLRVDQWRDKEATRDAVRQAIHDFLWSEDTGLPVDCFAEEDVEVKAEEVFRHVYRAYPTVPSPYFSAQIAI
jgi:type I restriction enzyme, R subunit